MKSGRSIQDVSREILRQQEAKADYASRTLGISLPPPVSKRSV